MAHRLDPFKNLTSTPRRVPSETRSTTNHTGIVPVFPAAATNAPPKVRMKSTIVIDPVTGEHSIQQKPKRRPWYHKLDLVPVPYKTGGKKDVKPKPLNPSGIFTDELIEKMKIEYPAPPAPPKRKRRRRRKPIDPDNTSYPRPII